MIARACDSRTDAFASGPPRSPGAYGKSSNFLSEKWSAGQAPVLIPIVQVDQLKISTGSIALLVNLSQIVAAGAYFYRLEGLGQRATQRMVWVR